MNICALITVRERVVDVSFGDKYYGGKHSENSIAKRGPEFRRYNEKVQH